MRPNSEGPNFKQSSFLLTIGYFSLDLLCFSLRKVCFSFWMFWTDILCLNNRICCCSIGVGILLGVASCESLFTDLSPTGFWTGCFYVLKLCKHVSLCLPLYIAVLIFFSPFPSWKALAFLFCADTKAGLFPRGHCKRTSKVCTLLVTTVCEVAPNSLALDPKIPLTAKCYVKFLCQKKNKCLPSRSGC